MRPNEMTEFKKAELSNKTPNTSNSYLEKGWVIANHILVSFHVAFITSLLSLGSGTNWQSTDVLKFVFFSPETLVSALFLWFVGHTAIAVHEMGHYLKAVKVDILNAKLLPEAKKKLSQPRAKRIFWYLKMYFLIPYGKFPGVLKSGLNYYANAPFNLAVAASGPRASRKLSIISFPLALGLLTLGLLAETTSLLNLGILAPVPIYFGRVFLGLALVGLLDFSIADPGKYKEFNKREKMAAEKAQAVEKVSGWYDLAPAVKQRMLTERSEERVHPTLGKVTLPWQFRNCGMGGKHTEKEYPESNISMQEAMFIILGVTNWQESQEMTVRLQNRLKEIIEKSEGSRVMGIGLEGGLAPYVEKADYALPELRLWTMMKQAIEECGYQAGKDVAIGLDPATSELENAYRKEYGMPDSVGMYLFWRDKAKISLDRDGILAIYKEAIQKHEIPIISIEDGFAEDDHEGWKMLLNEMGDRLWIIGDDLITTNDHTIEIASQEGLNNAALIKANQIGTLYETILAMLVALGKNQELVISHRSKSPNDDMETQIALAVNSMGIKAGGGANTERLFKYQSGIVLMRKLEEGANPISLKDGEQALIRKFNSYEESTNAGIPTVGLEIEIQVPSVGALLKFKGATPLGTSAGTGEAIHLVDSLIEYADHRELIDKYPDFFQKKEEGVYEFNKKIGDSQIKATQNAELIELFRLASRYEGKGCLNAVNNVLTRIAPQFEGKDLTSLTLRDIDTTLLRLERDLAIEREKLSVNDAEAQIHVMQRKQNLGMNAILTTSLALARAVANIQGKDLYGLIREEVISIIASLANDNQVQIKGQEVSDYIAALREVNQILEKENKALYATLREQTKIYNA